MKKVMLAFSTLCLSLVILVVVGCSSNDDPVVPPPPGIDITPAAFGFTSQSGVPLNTLITSDSITVSGLDAAATAPISVSADSAYAINGGTFGTAAGTVVNGDTVAVQHTSSITAGTATVTTLNIGGVNGTFTSTTASTALGFGFPDQTGVPLITPITSDSYEILGLPAPAAISVSVGSAYAINAGPFVTTPGTVDNGDTVTVRHTSSAVTATATVTTLTIGAVTGTFTSTTAPFSFSFISQEGVDPSVDIITSNIITITGLAAPAAISVSPLDPPVNSLYNLNNFGWIAGEATVVNGDTVAVQHTLPLTEGTATVTTLTIGGVTGTFTSTTRSHAFGQAVYDANCTSCHFLGLYDPPDGTELGPDLAGNGDMLSPTGPPLVLVPPVAGHPVIDINTGQIANLAFFLGDPVVLP